MNTILQNEGENNSSSEVCTTDLFHEEPLCSMKLYKSGLLEVTPGFSNVEPEESDDDEIFISSESLEKRAIKGEKLTSFTFATLEGSVYQYTLEWIDYLIDQDELESLALREMDEHYRILSHRQKSLFWRMNENNSMDSLTRIIDEDLIHIDFESASGFYPKSYNSSLSIEYDITLPDGWKYSIADFSESETAEDDVYVGSTRLMKPAGQSTFAGNFKLTIQIFLICILFILVSE